MLSKQGHNPVYALLEFNLGGGVVGGKMISGHYQGEQMAILGNRILNGEKPESIPVVTQGANRFLYDYRQLQRFDIPESALPVGSIIRYRPDTFYTQNKQLIWMIVWILTVQMLTIVMLLANRRKRLRAEAALLETQNSLERRVHERTASLKDSELKFRNLYDTAMVGLFRTSLSGNNLLEANPALAKMFLYKSIEDMKATFKPKDVYINQSQREQLLTLLKRDGYVEQFEIEAKRQDGTIITVILSATWYPKQEAMEGSIMDITERKKSEQAMLEVSHRLELAAHAGGIGIWEVDLINERLLWDDRMFQIFQTDPDEFQGILSDWSDKLIPEDLEKTKKLLMDSIDGKANFDTEFA